VSQEYFKQAELAFAAYAKNLVAGAVDELKIGIVDLDVIPSSFSMEATAVLQTAVNAVDGIIHWECDLNSEKKLAEFMKIPVWRPL
jgi:hypothetical protein